MAMSVLRFGSSGYSKHTAPFSLLPTRLRRLASVFNVAIRAALGTPSPPFSYIHIGALAILGSRPHLSKQTTPSLLRVNPLARLILTARDDGGGPLFRLPQAPGTQSGRDTVRGAKGVYSTHAPTPSADSEEERGVAGVENQRRGATLPAGKTTGNTRGRGPSVKIVTTSFERLFADPEPPEARGGFLGEGCDEGRAIVGQLLGEVEPPEARASLLGEEGRGPSPLPYDLRQAGGTLTPRKNDIR
ncbi:hypothetical protein GGG16DRAFT_107575 [Schizophyllum commune]